MTDKHHYFFAVKLPTEVKTFLNHWVQMHEAEFPFARWVHPEDYHITLAFLGFAEEEKLNLSINGVGERLQDVHSFELTLNELGTFGAPKTPRIFWADVLPSDELKAVQQNVYEKCTHVGFELDKKPFKPHITLARKWEGEHPFTKEKLTKLNTSVGENFTFTVSEITLYETHLDQSPKYKEVVRFKLSNNE